MGIKRQNMKPIDKGANHQEIAEDQVNGGTIWVKERNQKSGLKYKNGMSHEITKKSEKTESEWNP